MIPRKNQEINNLNQAQNIFKDLDLEGWVIKQSDSGNICLLETKEIIVRDLTNHAMILHEITHALGIHDHSWKWADKFTLLVEKYTKWVSQPRKEGRMKVKCGKNEEVSLAKLNELFRDTMLKRLLEKVEDGWEGWNNKRKMSQYSGGLKERIIRNVLEGDWVDVANLAMFAWNFED